MRRDACCNLRVCVNKRTETAIDRDDSEIIRLLDKCKRGSEPQKGIQKKIIAYHRGRGFAPLFVTTIDENGFIISLKFVP